MTNQNIIDKFRLEPTTKQMLFGNLLRDVFDREVESEINKSLANLHEETQAIIRLFYFENMSLSEISSRTGMPLKDAIRAKTNGIRRLRHPIIIRRLEEWMEYFKERDSVY